MNIIAAKFHTKPNTRHGKAALIAVTLMPIWFGLLFYRFVLETKGLNALWYDNFDSRLILWIFERNFLSIKNQPLSEFWNANQFYPIQGSLAFSDSIIAGQLIYAPMRLIGFTPLESMYITFFFIIALSSYLIVWIASEFITLSTLEWIIFCFICQFSLTITTYLNHYQLFAFQLASPFFLLLYSILLNPTGSKVIGITTLFIAICSFATYFAPMSVSISVVVLLVILACDRKRLWSMLRICIKNKYQIITSAILLGVFFYIQILPYVATLRELPQQNLTESEVYSANLLSIINSPSLSSLTYKANQINGYWEYSYFPGFVILLGLILGVFNTKRHTLATAPLLNIFMTTLLLVALVLSLGPYFHVHFFDKDLRIPLPFYLFSKIIPGVENIRAPGRYGAFLTLPLAYFFLMAIKSQATGKLRNLFLTIVLAVLIYDSRVSGTLYPFTTAQNEFFDEVASRIEYRDPTLILPLHEDTHFDNILNYINQLHISNQTGAWVVAGYGAKSTDILGHYTELSRQVSRGEVSIEGLFCEAYKDGIINIILTYDFSKILNKFPTVCNFNLVIDNGSSVMYRLAK